MTYAARRNQPGHPCIIREVYPRLSPKGVSYTRAWRGSFCSIDISYRWALECKLPFYKYPWVEKYFGFNTREHIRVTL